MDNADLDYPDLHEKTLQRTDLLISTELLLNTDPLNPLRKGIVLIDVGNTHGSSVSMVSNVVRSHILGTATKGGLA